MHFYFSDKEEKIHNGLKQWIQNQLGPNGTLDIMRVY